MMKHNLEFVMHLGKEKYKIRLINVLFYFHKISDVSFAFYERHCQAPVKFYKQNYHKSNAIISYTILLLNILS